KHHRKACIFMWLNARDGVHNYANGILHNVFTLNVDKMPAQMAQLIVIIYGGTPEFFKLLS
ncbi:MAG: hypothetical protein VYA04_04785, partial [Pseudomonadota bacterium]|nr:hypothetical protein [Pseudomonadota bacterium]